MQHRFQSLVNILLQYCFSRSWDSTFIWTSFNRSNTFHLYVLYYFLWNLPNESDFPADRKAHGNKSFDPVCIFPHSFLSSFGPRWLFSYSFYSKYQHTCTYYQIDESDHSSSCSQFSKKRTIAKLNDLDLYLLVCQGPTLGALFRL